MIDRIDDIIATMTNTDHLSWIAHLLIVWGTTVLVGGLAWQAFGKTTGTWVGFILADVWVLYFAFREGKNIVQHQVAGDDMKRSWRDMVGDIAGPLLNHIVWIYALVSL